MIFHKTNDHENPGVCEYDSLTAQQNLLKKSPKATIGKSIRFPRKSSLNEFASNLPEQYVKNHSKLQTKPAKLGTFNNQKRWSNATITPGVGDYDITRFKNISKVNETNFETLTREELQASSLQKKRA